MPAGRYHYFHLNHSLEVIPLYLMPSRPIIYSASRKWGLSWWAASKPLETLLWPAQRAVAIGPVGRVILVHDVDVVQVRRQGLEHLAFCFIRYYTGTNQHTPKIKIGLIGVGIMGSRMAANLLAAAYEVPACDINPE